MPPLTDSLQSALEKAETLEQCLAGLAPGSTLSPELAEAVQQLAPALADVRRVAQAALGESQERYRRLFDYSPVSLWEEDFTSVLDYLDALRAQGVTDLEAYWAAHPDAAAEGLRRVRVLDVNEAAVRLYGAASKSDLLSQRDRLFGPEAYPFIGQALTALARGEREFEAEGAQHRLTGERLDVSVRLAMSPGQASLPARVLVSVSDITQRRQDRKSVV
jgi:PAS domain-containing protein